MEKRKISYYSYETNVTKDDEDFKIQNRTDRIKISNKSSKDKISTSSSCSDMKRVWKSSLPSL